MRLGVLAVVVLALVIGSCDQGADDRFDAREPGQLETWVKKHHWRGAADKVSFEAGTLTLESQDRIGSNRIFTAASDVERLMKSFKLAAANKDALKVLRVVRHSELADRYHNSVGFKPVLVMRFDAQEVLKYNFEKTVVFSLLDAAQVEFTHPAIGDVKKEYCDSDSGKYSPGFCRGGR